MGKEKMGAKKEVGDGNDEEVGKEVKDWEGRKGWNGRSLWGLKEEGGRGRKKRSRKEE